MKSVFSLYIFSLSLTYASAQHCPFDNSGLLVVSIVDAKTKKPVTHIQPYLTIKSDSYDTKEAKTQASVYPFSQGDSLFVLNPKHTDKKWTDGYQLQKINYHFAKGYFIRPISMDLENIDNLNIGAFNKNGEDLGIYYTVTAQDFYDLHDNFGHNWFEISKLKSTPAPSHPFNKLIVIEINQN
ncbi:hypothetical protein OB69_16380 [Roseivirga seohaensis subsp. aquiponti]|uniref:Uncharacterized protein n=1 Tax=Roseivirga seohaensis subsp. aquiponti TaxID=1566026 RepID=A0A0L8AHC5_9BACT|nr:hypothetical protein [Roseivirga seohaensis]KOF01671.1 hypothetical protein OB69_16380 [Roseivirga seohaensis subsp. aquiponti]